MKTRKLTTMAIVLLCTALAWVACEPKPSDGKGGRGGKRNKIERMLDEDIAKLSHETDWTKAQQSYITINADIDKYVKKSRVKQDFHIAADMAYCNSMDTIMHLIMVSDCQSQHKMLDELWKLRGSGSYASVSSKLHTQVAKERKTHDDLLAYIKSVRGNRQTGITSFNTAYDKAYETQEIKNATSKLEHSPSCQEIRNGLENIKKGTAFVGRQAAFCQKLMDLYLEKDEWNQGDENKLKDRIRFYTDAHKDNETVLLWFDEIEAFKEERKTN